MLPPKEPANLTSFAYPVMVQPKLKGLHLIYNGNLFTKKGKRVKNKALDQYLEVLGSCDDHVFEGVLSGEDLEAEDLIKLEDFSKTKFYVFDCLPQELWASKNGKLPYQKRLQLARSLIGAYIADYSKVIDVATDLVQEPKDVLKFYGNYLKKGLPGIIIRDPNENYYWKRLGNDTNVMSKLSTGENK
jgi:hypothetical protein